MTYQDVFQDIDRRIECSADFNVNYIHEMATYVAESTGDNMNHAVNKINKYIVVRQLLA